MCVIQVIYFYILIKKKFSKKKGTRFILLHTAQNTDGIRNLFQDLHELYLKVLLNPFQSINSPITQSQFDARVKALVKKWT
jgi:hypothetical protein